MRISKIFVILIIALVIGLVLSKKKKRNRPTRSHTFDDDDERPVDTFDERERSTDCVNLQGKTRFCGLAQKPLCESDYDHYVLAFTWGPGFCTLTSDSQSCRPLDENDLTFTIHGMWPSRIESRYSNKPEPQHCGGIGTHEPFKFANLKPIEKDMSTYWKDYKRVGADTGLWCHEWSTHGTCYGTDQLEYFNTTITTVKALPNLTKAVQSIVYNGKKITPSTSTRYPASIVTQQLERLYKGSVALKCNRNYLQEIWLCLDKNFKPSYDCSMPNPSCNSFTWLSSVLQNF